MTTAVLHAGLPEKVAAWPAAVRQLLGANAGHRHGRFGLMMAAGGLLFPCEQDLHPFRALLLLAMTDCTPEELADLRLTDIEFSDGAVRLRRPRPAPDASASASTRPKGRRPPATACITAAGTGTSPA
ncbi:MAG TPA: hypothetical protein VIV12_30255 [Streptosporangiaceae bacterium]